MSSRNKESKSSKHNNTPIIKASTRRSQSVDRILHTTTSTTTGTKKNKATQQQLEEVEQELPTLSRENSSNQQQNDSEHSEHSDNELDTNERNDINIEPTIKSSESGPQTPSTPSIKSSKLVGTIGGTLGQMGTGKGITQNTHPLVDNDVDIHNDHNVLSSLRGNTVAAAAGKQSVSVTAAGISGDTGKGERGIR